MFGKNEVVGPFRMESGDLLVNELFFTIQGEGPDAGRPAIFLRLSKCNLRCYFCDTEFEQGIDMTRDAVARDIMKLSQIHRCQLVVITGGEPLLQNIVPLVILLNAAGVSVSVETAGTVYYPELSSVFDAARSISENLVVCSPKTPKISPDLERIVGAWKYVIRSDEIGDNGLPVYSTQRRGTISPVFRPIDIGVPIYVQPMDMGNETANARNMRMAAKVAMDHGYRLSAQLHKLAGLR